MPVATFDRTLCKDNAEGPEFDAREKPAPTSGKRSPSVLIQNPPLCVTPVFGASINSYRISGIVTPEAAARLPKFDVLFVPAPPVAVAIFKSFVYFSVPDVPGSTSAPVGRIAFQ